MTEEKHKRRSMLEMERLRLERKRKKASDKAYRRKQYELDVKEGKYPKCPACGRFHPEKAHATVASATRSANALGVSASTDTSTESSSSTTSEDSSSQQTES